jgi:hypothetical protein
MSDIRPVREPTERRSYRDVDAFETDDGKVMVCLAKPGHRIAEEYVPVAEVERLREALADLIGNADCRCDHPLVQTPCAKCRATRALNAS